MKKGSPGSVVRHLTTNSRALEPDAIFVALKGDRFDGHDFVEQCAQAGAGGAIVNRGWVAPTLPSGFALIEVEDTLRAYQDVAASYRKSLPISVIAITGSNGKTSTKDMTAAVLGRRFKVMKTQGNLNNHIGVPQTLLSATKIDQVAVLEIGMNHPGEIAPLAMMAQPDIAIITNIGSAHIEFMKTRAAIAQEKGVLAEAIGPAGHVILPAQDDFATSIAQRTRARVVTVGINCGDLKAESISEDLRGSRFLIVEGRERQEVRLPIPGLHMVINALLAVAAGRAQGLSLSDCVEGLETVQLTKGRLEVKTVGDLQIIDDSYNANPDSMVAALKTLAGIPTLGRRIAVLGRMGELGEHSEAGHRQVGDAAAAAHLDYVIAVGSEPRFIAENARAGGLRDLACVSNATEAALHLDEIAQTGDLILVKGSRSAAMENVINTLIERRKTSAEHAVP